MFSNIMKGIGKAFFVITYSAILGFFTFLGYLLFSGFKCMQMQSKPNTDQGNETNFSVNFDQCSSTLAVSVAALTIAGVSLYYAKNCYQMTRKQCLKFRNRDHDNTATPSLWNEPISGGSSGQILPNDCGADESNPGFGNFGTDSDSDDEEHQTINKNKKHHKRSWCQIS